MVQLLARLRVPQNPRLGDFNMARHPGLPGLHSSSTLVDSCAGTTAGLSHTSSGWWLSREGRSRWYEVLRLMHPILTKP